MQASDILDPPPSPSIGSRKRAPQSALAAPAMTSWDDEVQATISKYSGAGVHAAQEPEGGAAPSVESDLGDAPRAAAGVADCECAESCSTDPVLARAQIPAKLRALREAAACADPCAVPSRRARVDASGSRSRRTVRHAAAARHRWARRLARHSDATGGQR